MGKWKHGYCIELGIEEGVRVPRIDFVLDGVKVGVLMSQHYVAEYEPLRVDSTASRCLQRLGSFRYQRPSGSLHEDQAYMNTCRIPPCTYSKSLSDNNSDSSSPVQGHNR